MPNQLNHEDLDELAARTVQDVRAARQRFPALKMALDVFLRDFLAEGWVQDE